MYTCAKVWSETLHLIDRERDLGRLNQQLVEANSPSAVVISC